MLCKRDNTLREAIFTLLLNAMIHIEVINYQGTSVGSFDAVNTDL